MWKASNSESVRSLNWLTPMVQEAPDLLCSSYFFRFSEKMLNLLWCSDLSELRDVTTNTPVSPVLPGVVLLSKLLLELSKPHLVISEAGAEAEGQEGGEDD